MKFTKQLRFAALSVACVAVLASCIKDPVGFDDSDPTSTRLAISLPGLSNGMTTRAGLPAAYDAIHNLNIFITSGDQILHRLYIGSVSGNFTGTDGDAGITGTTSSTDSKYVVEYPAAWLEAHRDQGIHRRGMNNYIVVANYGSAISAATAANVPALRALQVAGGANINAANAVMYGESGMSVTVADNGMSGLKSVKLERSVAIITLQINGSALANDVQILPTTVRLRNVPVSTNIAGFNSGGAYNVVTTTPGGVTPKDNAVASNGEQYSAAALWGQTPITRTNSTRGGHYTVNNGVITASSNVTPLYMYENYHGGNAFGATEATEITKRPAAAEGATEAQIDAVAGACSYLEVEARLVNDAGDVANMVYRVFLGADATQNFDILRNHYYRVTLTLSGTAQSETDASWRLDVAASKSHLLYLDTTDPDVPLKVGSWLVGDENNSDFRVLTPATTLEASGDYPLAFFKFGSVIGFDTFGSTWTSLNTGTGNSAIWFNPTGLTIGANTGGGPYTNDIYSYSTIPSFEASDYNAPNNISNVSGDNYHNAANIWNEGKGDPCRLAGIDVTEFKALTTDAERIAYLALHDSGWRLPTREENNLYFGLDATAVDNLWLLSSRNSTTGGAGVVYDQYLWSAGTGVFLGNPDGVAQLPAAGRRGTDGGVVRRAQEYINNNTINNAFTPGNGPAGNYWLGDVSTGKPTTDGFNFGFEYERAVPNSPNSPFDSGYAIRCVEDE